MSKSTTPLRIGIFAGSFNPVHAGHVAFALQVMQAADLDEVVFLPERRPRYKPSIEHYAHRVAMIKRAIRPHHQFSVLELVDRNFTVSRTLPQLQALFGGHQLVFMIGSDVVPNLPQWPYAKRMLQQVELAVGVRAGQNRADIAKLVADWSIAPMDMVLVNSYAADISSARIRHALRADHGAKGLLASVKQYAQREWLYVSPGSTLS